MLVLSGDTVHELLGFQQTTLPQQFQLAGERIMILEVDGEDRVLSMLEPVIPRLADAMATRAVAIDAPRRLAKTIELLMVNR